MGPAKVDFTIWRGTAPTLLFGPVLDRNGEVLDVTGWTGKFVMREAETSPDPVALEADSAVVSPPANGYLQVPLSKTQTLALKAKTTYDFGFMRTNAGAEDLLTEGRVTVRFNILNPV